MLKTPQNNAGKSFTNELSHVFDAFPTSSALETVTLKAATVLPKLLLQRPFHNSKTKDHIKCLEMYLSKWKEVDLTSSLGEGKTIQD